MEIEIGLIGKPNRWVFNQSRIRIGHDAQCDISFPAGQYPAVYGEHLVLDVVNSAVRVSTAGGSEGETYLNDRLAGPGAVVRSGDILRLGGGGPELRIRLMERDTHPSSAEYEPTRVLHDATREISGAGGTSVLPTPPAGAPRRHGYETVATPAVAAHSSTPSPSSASPRHPDSPPNSGGVAVGQGQMRGRETSTPGSLPAASKEAGGGNYRILEDRLKFMRVLLVANLLVLLALLVWVFQLNRQLEQNRDELREMRVQAQTAVSQFTPALDARLDKFEQRMDGLDAKMQSAENHLVNRMNAEIPSMLDKYIERKLAQAKVRP